MRLVALLPLSSLCLAALAPAQTTGQNAKIIHNAKYTNAVTRVGNTKETLYYMQPREAHRGYGKFAGWKATLTDLDYRTPDSFAFGMVRYAKTGLQPDVTAAGIVVLTASIKLPFPPPGQGTRSDAIWTLTLNTPVTAPREFGLRIDLPAPASNSDSTFIHTQVGAGINNLPGTKLKPSVQQQWTYYLNGNLAAGFWSKATTLDFGSLLEKPVVKAFISSTAYRAAAEDLFGLEAHWPEAGRKDRFGWFMEGDAFQGGFGVVMVSGALFPKPLVTPFGTLFMNPPFGIVQGVFPLHATKGTARTPTLPVPAGIKFHTQAAFLDKALSRIEVSDSIEVNTLQ